MEENIESNVGNQTVSQPQQTETPDDYNEDIEPTDREIEDLNQEAGSLQEYAKSLNSASIERLSALERLFENASNATQRREDLNEIRGMVLRGSSVG